MEKAFDVVVIGAGPGGYTAAIRAAGNGLSTALIEKESRLGGTCLLRGCVPTKSLLETARRMDELKRPSDFGIGLSSPPALDMQKVLRRKDRLIARLSTGIAGLCRNAGVEVFQGTASFVSPKQIRVLTEDGENLTLNAGNVIIATGSRVRNLPGITPDHVRILTSDSALCLDRVPRRLLVIGSGAVGLEFASAFRSLGSEEVTIAEAMDQVLPGADEDVSAELNRALRRRRIEVLTGASVLSVSQEEGCVRSRIRLQDAEIDMEKDAVLVAVGREANADDLRLEAAGLSLVRGRIPVSETMETSVKGVYAIGDLLNSPALAHTAMREGCIAADAIAGKPVRTFSGDAVPFAVYAAPEAAFVGLTEKNARLRGIPVTIGKFPFAASAKAVICGETEGFVKIVAEEKTGRILGAHMVGLHVTELIAEMSSAVANGLTLEQTSFAIHAHPTLSEAMGEAALAALGRPLGI